MGAPTFDVDNLLELFFEEAEEHVTAFERGLLELESSPTDRELIATIFRAAHSLKGGSGTLGLGDIMTFTHALETVLDRLRKSEIAYDAAVSRVVLGSVDVLRGLLANARAKKPPPPEAIVARAALEEFYAFRPQATETPPATATEAFAPARERTVEIAFRPKEEFLSRGMDPLGILRDLAAAGAVEARHIDLSALPDLAALDPERFFLSFRMTLRTSRTDAELREVFAYVDDLCAYAIEERARPERTPEARPDAAPVTAPKVGGALAGAPSAATIRVATEKVDRLLDLVGELVIAQAMIIEATRTPSADARARLHDALTAMERHTRDLQERVMSIRMVPLSTVFRRLPRMVHDLAAALQKQVRLEIEGEGTEIDKSMVELLADPLMHLVRNAIDHGLEAASDRLAAGKEPEGRILLRALHQGGNVVIEVSDDGRGLDRLAIRTKAERQRLIARGAVLTDCQIDELVFQPGFSTAAVVSDVSGRGVGMDVVKRNVESLNGSLAISSEVGVGTRVRLRLPLTLAILEGLAVRVGEETFILPLLSVLESFRPSVAQVRSIFGAPEVVDVRGSSLPIVRLHEVFGTPKAESDPSKALVCVVESTGGQLAVLVDEVLGQHQVVVKSLEVNFRKVAGLMGATILGDGRVAMIVDVQALSRGSRSKSQPDTSARAATPAQEIA